MAKGKLQAASDRLRTALTDPAIRANLAAASREGLASIREAGEFLSVSRATIYKLMDTGKLRSVKIGKCRRIPWVELEKMTGGSHG